MWSLLWLLCGAAVAVPTTLAPEEDIGITQVAVAALTEQTQEWTGWMYKALTEGLLQFTIDSQDPKCFRDGLLYRQNLENLTLWAARMFDASALSPNGFVSGDVYQFGHFDECVSIEVPKEQITGKYCLASIQYGAESDNYIPPSSASVWDRLKVSKDRRMVRKDVLHWAVCVPSSCGASDIEDSLRSTLLQPLQEQGILANISLSQDDCYSVWEQPPFNSGYYIVMGILYFMAFICVSATILDYATGDQTNTSKPLRRFIKVFSTSCNMKKLIKYNPEADYKLIHCLKFFGIYCVILGHKEMYSFGNPIHNPQFIESFYDYVSSMIFLNGGGYIVDTFFMFSGFLTCHFLVKELKKRQRVNILVLIGGRILRILPVYMFIIAFHATVLPYLGSGPLWNAIVWREALRCQKNWWANLLFINNYVDVEEVCMVQSWYLACDMHFFIIGVALVYTRFKHPKLGTVLIAAASAAAVAIPTYITYVNQYKGVVQLYHDLQEDPVKNEHFRSMYIPSHARFIPYMVGMLMSYLNQYLDEVNFKIPGVLLFFLFPLGVIVNLATTFLAYIFYEAGRPYSLLENVLYAGLHRIFWAVSIMSLIVIDSTTGFGKWISILKHPAWAPLGRLTYCAFLVHTLPLLYNKGQMRVAPHHTRMTVAMSLMGDVASATTFALVLNLFFESPLQRLQKVILKKLFDAPRKSGLIQQNIVHVVDGQLNLTCGISKISIQDETDFKVSSSEHDESKFTYRDENGVYRG